jgi:hypothetical protein
MQFPLYHLFDVPSRQEEERILGHRSISDLKVQMGTARPARTPNQSDHLSLAQPLSFFDEVFLIVRIDGM